jgi:hypothetical protein
VGVGGVGGWGVLEGRGRLGPRAGLWGGGERCQGIDGRGRCAGAGWRRRPVRARTALGGRADGRGAERSARALRRRAKALPKASKRADKQLGAFVWGEGRGGRGAAPTSSGSRAPVATTTAFAPAMAGPRVVKSTTGGRVRRGWRQLGSGPRKRGWRGGGGALPHGSCPRRPPRAGGPPSPCTISSSPAPPAGSLAAAAAASRASARTGTPRASRASTTARPVPPVAPATNTCGPPRRPGRGAPACGRARAGAAGPPRAGQNALPKGAAARTARRSAASGAPAAVESAVSAAPALAPQQAHTCLAITAAQRLTFIPLNLSSTGTACACAGAAPGVGAGSAAAARGATTSARLGAPARPCCRHARAADPLARAARKERNDRRCCVRCVCVAAPVRQSSDGRERGSGSPRPTSAPVCCMTTMAVFEWGLKRSVLARDAGRLRVLLTCARGSNYGNSCRFAFEKGRGMQSASGLAHHLHCAVT